MLKFWVRKACSVFAGCDDVSRCGYKAVDLGHVGPGFQLQIADRIKIRIYYQTWNVAEFEVILLSLILLLAETGNVFLAGECCKKQVLVK